MAVVRITAPQRWHLRAAEVLVTHPRANRELLRAAERRGLTAEFQPDELRALAEHWPLDTYVAAALVQLEACEHRERTRPRARDIALGRFRK